MPFSFEFMSKEKPYLFSDLLLAHNDRLSDKQYSKYFKEKYDIKSCYDAVNEPLYKSLFKDCYAYLKDSVDSDLTREDFVKEHKLYKGEKEIGYLRIDEYRKTRVLKRKDSLVYKRRSEIETLEVDFTLSSIYIFTDRGKVFYMPYTNFNETNVWTREPYDFEYLDGTISEKKTPIVPKLWLVYDFKIDFRNPYKYPRLYRGIYSQKGKIFYEIIGPIEVFKFNVDTYLAEETEKVDKKVEEKIEEKVGSLDREIMLNLESELSKLRLEIAKLTESKKTICEFLLN